MYGSFVGRTIKRLEAKRDSFIRPLGVPSPRSDRRRLKVFNWILGILK
jgi:hypothetical protein